MIYQKPVPRTQNQLWLARKRKGLEQKQVAYLLGLSPDKVSRYEKGRRLPGLQTALGMQIIYGLPPHVLFKGLFEMLRRDIAERINKRATLQAIYGSLLSDTDQLAAWCSYTELLKNAHLSQAEKDRVRTHVVQLMRELADK